MTKISICGINFSFWSSLLTKRYKDTLWRTALRFAFPHSPSPNGLLRIPAFSWCSHKSQYDGVFICLLIPFSGTNTFHREKPWRASPPGHLIDLSSPFDRRAYRWIATQRPPALAEGSDYVRKKSGLGAAERGE